MITTFKGKTDPDRIIPTPSKSEIDRHAFMEKRKNGANFKHVLRELK